MGPLQGIKIIEFAGLGPAPFCGMLLSDLGAEVVRIERPSTQPPLFDPSKDILNRGRRSLELDLKHPPALAAVRTMLEQADALIEGFRPGVMERLGLGPDECLTRNPKLVYGRMTGWGQDGPLAHSAGHDINYIALTGALHAIGRSDSGPVPPLNLVGDFGGGALFLALGITAALLETRQSGQGQVIDAAMTDGAALLMAMMYSLKAMGQWRNERGSNMLDSGAPFYDTYQCADGRWVAIGPIEPQFYTLLLEKCGLQDDGLSAQWDRERWLELKQKLAAVFARKTRAEWCALLEGSDACFAPVLDLDEAPQHPHNQFRHTFVDIDGLVQPAPAPRFSRTPTHVQSPPTVIGAHSEAVLRDWGLSPAAIRQALGH